MTTFRSKTADAIGRMLFLIGLIGFLVCWGIAWDAQSKVLGRSELPSTHRTAPIEMKGVTWYVDPAFARRYRLAENWSLIFWLGAAAGAAIVVRGKITAWFRTTGGTSIFP